MRRRLDPRWIGRAVLTLIAFGTLTGCATLPNGRGWGEDVTFSPGWKRLGDAAVGAILSPRVWVPATGAVLLQPGDLDSRLGNWAVDRAPLFGSPHDAGEASDHLVHAAEWFHWATAVMTPSGDEAGEWIVSKAKGVAVALAAIGLTHETTELVKRQTGRVRPDRSDDLSFPSGHSSIVAVHATLAGRNILSLPLGRGAGTALGIFSDLLATGSAWARVEARKHYPSDVLAGLALGNFLGSFIHEAFMGSDDGEGFPMVFASTPDGVIVGFRIQF